MKVGIIMMTEFSGHAHKADRMPEIIHEFYKRGELGYSFGLKYKKDERVYSPDELAYLRRTVLHKPLYFLTRKFSRILLKFRPDFSRYYMNEIIFGILVKMFYRPKSYPDVVILKPRPSFLAEYFKEKGCTVLVEASENHTRYTENQLLKEYERLGMKPFEKDAYINEPNIVDFEKGISKSDGLICLTKKSMETYVKWGYREAHIRTVPIYVNMPGQKNAFHGNEVVFVSVANHNPLKGTYQLIKEWIEYSIKSRLVIIGPISKNLQEMIGTLKMPSNIEFLGAKSRDEITDFYRKHTCVGILLSFSESFGRSVYECMSEAVPVIVTPECTLDLVKDGYNGYIVDPTIPGEVYNAIAVFENITKEQYEVFSKHVRETIRWARQESLGSRYVTAVEELYGAASVYETKK